MIGPRAPNRRAGSQTECLGQTKPEKSTQSDLEEVSSQHTGTITHGMVHGIRQTLLCIEGSWEGLVSNFESIFI